MFDVPFFVFHTSNTSKETKFVWLQKYAETKLLQTTPEWEKQKSVTIYFPHKNDLKNNDSKLIEIVRKDKLTKVGVKFLAGYESLRFHADSVIEGEFAAGRYCADVADNLARMRQFIGQYGAGLKGEYSGLLNLPKVFWEIAERGSVTPDDRSYVLGCLEWLCKVKNSFLLRDDVDEIAVGLDFPPY